MSQNRNNIFEDSSIFKEENNSVFEPQNESIFEEDSEGNPSNNIFAEDDLKAIFIADEDGDIDDNSIFESTEESFDIEDLDDEDDWDEDDWTLLEDLDNDTNEESIFTGNTIFEENSKEKELELNLTNSLKEMLTHLEKYLQETK